MRIICEYFLIFMIYSLVGWIMETMLFAIRDKHIVKRGFLYGPLCPIYGTGAVLCSVLFYEKINNIFLIFILGLLVCGTLEYVTHFLMEKIFHAMWWDYSKRRFNIKGRVYLKGLVTFGIGAVLIVKILQPLIFKLINIIPTNVIYVLSFVLYSLVLIDLAITITRFLNLVNTLKELQEYIEINLQKGLDTGDEKLNNAVEEFKNSKTYNEIVEYLNNNKYLNQIRRKYPNSSSTKLKKIFEIIADKPTGEGRTDIKLYGDYEEKTEK